MPKSVLILTCDSGGGHRSVADALAGALEHLYPGRYRFHIKDIMADCFAFPLSAAGRAYGPVVNRLPRAWGLLWHSTNGKRRSPLLLRLVGPLAYGKLTRTLHDIQPGIVVSTHPWSNHLPAWLLQRRDLSTPLVTVVTDPVSIHHWWLYPKVDLCLVPTEQAERQAISAGLPPQKVRIIGLPVGLEFIGEPSDKSEARARLGLAPEAPTILVSGGGDGMGAVFAAARAVAQIAREIQLVIVAGRNQTLKAKLETTPLGVPTTVVGFVDNMADFMSAADLLITKAGPSTISEALACGLPMLISGALRGQEEGNVDWVLNTGAAMLTTDAQELTATLQCLLRDGRHALTRMAEKAREAATPESSLLAAQLIDEVASQSR
jgi:1,2-diacylglycerol 3-beta-galactosyltransferase